MIQDVARAETLRMTIVTRTEGILSVSHPVRRSACGTLRQATFGVMWKTFVRQATADDLELLEAIENEADALFATVFSIVGWRPAPSYATPSQQSGFILVASGNPGSDPIGFAHVL